MPRDSRGGRGGRGRGRGRSRQQAEDENVRVHINYPLLIGCVERSTYRNYTRRQTHELRHVWDGILEEYNQVIFSERDRLSRLIIILDTKDNTQKI